MQAKHVALEGAAVQARQVRSESSALQAGQVGSFTLVEGAKDGSISSSIPPFAVLTSLTGPSIVSFSATREFHPP